MKGIKRIADHSNIDNAYSCFIAGEGKCRKLSFAYRRATDKIVALKECAKYWGKNETVV